MFTITEQHLKRLNGVHPGFAEIARRFDSAHTPACPDCVSDNTTAVHVGAVGRAIELAAATTRFKLLVSGPKPGEWWCNVCERYY